MNDKLAGDPSYEAGRAAHAEAVRTPNTGSPATPASSVDGSRQSGPLQFRVLWHERIAGDMYPFAGRVYTEFAKAEAELQCKREAYNHHWLMIEVRSASNTGWPHALDEAPSRAE